MILLTMTKTVPNETIYVPYPSDLQPGHAWHGPGRVPICAKLAAVHLLHRRTKSLPGPSSIVKPMAVRVAGKRTAGGCQTVFPSSQATSASLETKNLRRARLQPSDSRLTPMSSNKRLKRCRVVHGGSSKVLAAASRGTPAGLKATARFWPRDAIMLGRVECAAISSAKKYQTASNSHSKQSWRDSVCFQSLIILHELQAPQCTVLGNLSLLQNLLMLSQKVQPLIRTALSLSVFMF